MKRFFALFAVIALMMTMVSFASAEALESSTLVAADVGTAKGGDAAKASTTVPRGKTFNTFVFWEGDRLHDMSNGAYFTSATFRHYSNFRVTITGGSWLKASTSKLPYCAPNNTSAARTGKVVYRDSKGVVATFNVTQTGRYNITYYGQITQPYKCIQLKWTGTKSAMKVNYALFVITNNDFSTWYSKKVYDTASPATARWTGYPITAGNYVDAAVIPVKKMGSRYVSSRYVVQDAYVLVEKVGVYKKGKIYKPGWNTPYKELN